MVVPKKPVSKRLKKTSSSFKRSSGSHSNAVRPSTSSHAIFPVSLTCEERAELQQLAQLVPVANTRVANDPCALLRAAALYIDQLRTTVAVRVRNGTLPRVGRIFQMEQPIVKGRQATAADKRR
ncbi:unnamed protein product [Enterobius vermicularis]|uniref:BHLH domain-containing protein n=1 Tax=Enterobius vermicularis TaxID=51028 RepID=A0A0N4VJ42_ENTVE|nr:unnamed protein product [Enterobius vermicularis]